ncbi:MULTISPECIES: GNAT family N-acetyltransferase [unclassified Leifsonia]|uniref:GNAT family N-acetyltransferase n=1 Tax=unclassified Leifsonia TaxID=2663824 RepID=UPI0006F3AEE2|nr:MULTISPECIES: GNAT family N-acetyltransferase [unclassified Leifsonia]KQX05213.1 acetyltransferase [Leifsonia sp. Root1293]KRA08846.1 acetyltransferase [Leifsonia sp. Root60]
MTLAFSIRPTVADDWEQVRAIRLEMLADTPLAYAETRAHALDQPESEWRMRGARGQTDRGTSLVAIDQGGRWIGAMAGYLPDAEGDADDPVPLLVGVYVAPDVRGREFGVTDALLAGIEDWARTHGDTLALHVHEDNARAIAAYRSRGFELTDVTVPYNLDPAKLELEMIKRLGS